MRSEFLEAVRQLCDLFDEPVPAVNDIFCVFDRLTPYEMRLVRQASPDQMDAWTAAARERLRDRGMTWAP